MATALLQYDDRSSPLFEELMKLNIKYAVRHGYEYIRPTQIFDIPPWWIKVFLIQSLMKSRPDIKYIGWLDSDAVVHKQHQPISELFENAPDFLISYCPWNTGPKDRTVNVGVFFIRVNETSKNIMDTWATCYNPKRWHKDGGVWKTDGRWAGDDYEQGSLNKLVIPKYPKSFGIYMPAIFDCWESRPTRLTFSCHYCTPNAKKWSIFMYLLAQRGPELLLWGGIGSAAVYAGLLR
jgi:hypothetical protein